MSRLALFDLDNTLLAGDSDHAWGDWLVERGIVDGRHYKETNDRFYQDYLAGRLDILAYLACRYSASTRSSACRPGTASSCASGSSPWCCPLPLNWSMRTAAPATCW
jgi:hypothetical protein